MVVSRKSSLSNDLWHVTHDVSKNKDYDDDWEKYRNKIRLKPPPSLANNDSISKSVKTN
jgi:hypothetical protein